MTNDPCSFDPPDNRGNPQFDRPGSDATFDDLIELAGGRVWMLAQEYSDSFDNAPRIWLEQYHGQVDWDRRGPTEEDVTGRVWFHPEDIPVLIKTLSRWLKAYVQCAHADAKRRPARYWGNLLQMVEDIGGGSQERQE